MANTFDWVEIATRNVAETAGFYERRQPLCSNNARLNTLPQ